MLCINYYFSVVKSDWLFLQVPNYIDQRFIMDYSTGSQISYSIFLEYNRKEGGIRSDYMFSLEKDKNIVPFYLIRIWLSY